ncbi:UNVERIFIED_CONTAM: hypothetical protein GTU68_026272 [Idotea baltica]|nr:hypothetical protein [Idotea baltica]
MKPLRSVLLDSIAPRSRQRPLLIMAAARAFWPSRLQSSVPKPFTLLILMSRQYRRLVKMLPIMACSKNY